MKKRLSLIIILLLSLPFSLISEVSNEKGNSVKLREMVFSLDPKDIGLSPKNYKYPVWGIVMETGMSDGSYSLVVLAEGTTSLYFSNGGGIIGAGTHKNVKEASAFFIKTAQQFYFSAKKTKKYPRPSDGKVIFYFLTFDGTLSYSADEGKLEAGMDRLSNLFYAAHIVIGELRKAKEQSKI